MLGAPAFFVLEVWVLAKGFGKRHPEIGMRAAVASVERSHTPNDN